MTAALLIAKEPVTGLMMMGIGLVVGTITGYIVDYVHGRDFLRPDALAQTDDVATSNAP